MVTNELHPPQSTSINKNNSINSSLDGNNNLGKYITFSIQRSIFYLFFLTNAKQFAFSKLKKKILLQLFMIYFLIINNLLTIPFMFFYFQDLKILK